VGLVRFIESIFIRKEFRFLKAAHAWLDAENFNSWRDQSPRQSSVVRFIGSIFRKKFAF
jgi:NADH:ubiquinone oxidoreductase subunit B-like Fe-S oxidoreductase